MKQISVDQAAQIIGVSSATIRNWAKTGHLNPVSKRPISFLEEAIFKLKNQIGTESFERLKTRANKACSTSHFLPLEYVNNPKLVSSISNLITQFKNEKLEPEPLIYLATLRFLEEKGEVKRIEKNKLFHFSNYFSWKRSSVEATMQEWKKNLKDIKNEEAYHKVYEFLSPYESDDFLGLLYQSLSTEGSKSEQGAYYTPSFIVEDSLSQITSPIENFLDPCCGTGKYLILAAKKFSLSPENIFGFDCDPIAVHLARINLILFYKDKDFLPKIFCMDSLSELATGELFCETNFLIGKIDAIATNPPWGAYKNSTPNLFYGKIKSGETFSLFLSKSIQLLRKNGQLSFLLPESILKIKIHSDIRELILEETKITKISILGRQFTGVFTPVIRLDLVKTSYPRNWQISIEKNDQISLIEQEQFKKNENFTFNIETLYYEEELLKKIYSIEHLTLGNNAEWALGIVTGNNKKYILNKKEQDSEPIFRGSDVYPFYLGESHSFLHFTPESFQQVAPEKYFRAKEKLIYKFISKKLVFAYDDKQYLTLNSANILVPAIPNLRIKVVMAFLNSTIFQYIFQKKFSTHKVLRGDLEKLPFPLVNDNTQKVIEKLVDKAILNKKVPLELEEVIFLAFNLTKEDISIVKRGIKE